MSNETFQVGEIAILARAKFDHARVGLEAEIVAPLGVRRIWWPVPGENEHRALCYTVRYVDGRTANVEPWQLRKRRPPQDPAYVKFRDQLVREFAMGDRLHV